jgi:DNA-binding transcriptional regulator YhcF (GntR family)
MTVSKVYSILERDGVLENVRGQGMRVLGLTENRATLKERREMVAPLLKQVVNTAIQLKLDKKEVFGVLDNLWKE